MQTRWTYLELFLEKSHDGGLPRWVRLGNPNRGVSGLFDGNDWPFLGALGSRGSHIGSQSQAQVVHRLIQIGPSFDQNEVGLVNHGPLGFENRSGSADKCPNVFRHMRTNWRQNDGLHLDEFPNQSLVNVSHRHFTVRVAKCLVLEETCP